MSLCMNQWIHVGCLHIHDSQKKLHRTACDSPRNEVFWWLRSGRLQVWYPHSRFVRSTCSVVRPKARTFAVESSVKSFSCHWVKQHDFARPSFGGEQVTPNMSKHKLKLTFHNWSRTQRYTDGRNVAMSLKFCWQVHKWLHGRWLQGLYRMQNWMWNMTAVSSYLRFEISPDSRHIFSTFRQLPAHKISPSKN